jgi:hypothetical protein
MNGIENRIELWIGANILCKITFNGISYSLSRPDFERGLGGHPNVAHQLFRHESIQFGGNS